MTDQYVLGGDATDHAPDPTATDGMVLRWRRRGDVWEALLTREVDGRISTEWLPALVLAPTRLT